MSQRFPKIASQSDLASTRSKARVMALPQVPGLPWMELGLGLAMLLLLRGF